jgi:hypothetical protein
MTKATDTITNFEDLALHAVDGLILATNFIAAIADDELVPETIRDAASEAALTLAIGLNDISEKGLELSKAATPIDTPEQNTEVVNEAAE